MALVARHPEYALAFQDEVWWSRVTQPHLHAWAEKDEVLQLVAQTATKEDPDPKSLSENPRIRVYFVCMEVPDGKTTQSNRCVISCA